MESVKRARPQDEKDTVDSSSNPKYFVVVLLSRPYGSIDNHSVYYTCWSNLTPEQRKGLFHSTPHFRQSSIPGCDDQHDFGHGNDEHFLEGNIWTCLVKDDELSAFTRANHCEVTIAYFDE